MFKSLGITPLKKRNDWRQNSSGWIPKEILEYAKSIKLVENPQGSSSLYCPFCKVDVEPTKSFIQKHANDIKHRKKTAIYKSGNDVLSPEPVPPSSSSNNAIKLGASVESGFSNHQAPLGVSTSLSPKYTQVTEAVSRELQSVVELQQHSSYCFHRGFYLRNTTQRETMPNLSLKDVIVSSSSRNECRYKQLVLSFSEYLEPPWLLSSTTNQTKWATENIYDCLSEELKLFEHYISYPLGDVTQRQQVVTFVVEQLQTIEKSSVSVLDATAIEYFVPFDSILLFWRTSEYTTSLQKHPLLQQLNENDKHWQFCAISSNTTTETQRGIEEMLWITEQVVGVSIQVWIGTGDHCYIENPYLSDIFQDTELRSVVLCMKYMIYTHLHVCHFSDIYMLWLLLHFEKVLYWNSSHRRGYILMQLLCLLGQVMSHVAYGYSQEDKLSSNISHQDTYWKDIYEQFAVLCREAYQTLIDWDKCRCASPLGQLIANKSLFSAFRKNTTRNHNNNKSFT